MSIRRTAEEEHLSGLLWDLSDIWLHETQKALNFLWPEWYPYISDETIISTLSARGVNVYNSNKHMKEVQEHYHSISLSSFAEIRCDFGVTINTSRLFELLNEYFPATKSLNPAVGPETAALLDPRVKSIMARFGRIMGPPDAESKRELLKKDFIKVAKLDTMKKVAEMYLETNSSLQHSFRNGDQSDLGTVTLAVVIERARNIPKMDLFRGADVFCAVFLDGSPELYQTDIRRGSSEADWHWEPELSRDFQWKLSENSELLKLDRRVVVMVYDKDQISADDLIGCVIVQLGELVDGEFDAWKQVIQPPNAPTRQYIFFTAPKPELKLKISLSSATVGHQLQGPYNPCESVSEQMMLKQVKIGQGKAPSLCADLGFLNFTAASTGQMVQI